MVRERRKWSGAEDAILRDAVLKGGDGACDWHMIASCIPGRTNKDCRKRWHYKVAATVNKGPWEVAEDGRLWNAVQTHGSRWALVAQVVKTRNGDQCSKRWYDALDPSIDHSPWTPQEDRRLLEAIDTHGRNWKAIVKAYFPRRTSLSAKNRYSLLIRKMEPKNKQSQSGASKKANQKPSPKQQHRLRNLGAGKSETPLPRPAEELSEMEVSRAEDQSRLDAYRNSMSGSSLEVLFKPSCPPRNSSRAQIPTPFGSPLMNQPSPPQQAHYTHTPPPSDCPGLSPADWSGMMPATTASSEASFLVTTPPCLSEAMSLFSNDLQSHTSLSPGDPIQFATKRPEGMVSCSPSDGGSMEGSDFCRGVSPHPPSAGYDMSSRVVTVLINSEIPETVSNIVNHIGKAEGVSIEIHLG